MHNASDQDSAEFTGDTRLAQIACAFVALTFAIPFLLAALR